MFFTVNQPTVIVGSCVHILAALMHLGWDEYSIRTYFVQYRESSFSESSVNVVYTLVQSIAWFIWNAEISVSIAIHCYERLF